MNDKTFWNVSSRTGFLAIVLLVAVLVLVILQWQVPCYFAWEAAYLQQESNEVLAANIELQDDNVKYAKFALAFKIFLLKIEPDLEKLEEYSHCDYCCDVGGKISNMGGLFDHWLAQIVLFKLDFIALSKLDFKEM